jgi:hypothetical protein
LATFNISALEILAVRSVTIADVLIIVVLGIGLAALSFLNRVILI